MKSFFLLRGVGCVPHIQDWAQRQAGGMAAWYTEWKGRINVKKREQNM